MDATGRDRRVLLPAYRPSSPRRLMCDWQVMAGSADPIEVGSEEGDDHIFLQIPRHDDGGDGATRFHPIRTLCWQSLMAQQCSEYRDVSPESYSTIDTGIVLAFMDRSGLLRAR